MIVNILMLDFCYCKLKFLVCKFISLGCIANKLNPSDSGLTALGNSVLLHKGYSFTRLHNQCIHFAQKKILFPQENKNVAIGNEFSIAHLDLNKLRTAAFQLEYLYEKNIDDS